jgi:hypothetical protein
MLLIERTYSKSFRFDVFKTLENEKQFEYADKNLRLLGQGSSRWVYLLNSKRVLKLAINNAGIEQNKNELTVSQNPISKEFTTRVLANAPDVSWLVTELVKPLQSYDAGRREFLSLTGFKFSTMTDALYASKNLLKNKKFLQDVLRRDKNGFLRKLIRFVKSAGLEVEDISIPEQWGQTPDERIVLLDYGLTPETWDRHYANR